MNKESLLKAKELIITTLDNSDINLQDKLELMINLYSFLEEENYDRNIKVLQKEERGK